MNESPVKVLQHENWIQIVLAGPRGNAMNADMIEALESAMVTASGDPTCQGALLSAEGSVFSPGLDLKEVYEFDREEMACFIDAFTGLVRTIYEFPKPLVAALEGATLAGGMLIALATDWRVLGAQTLIGLNELKVAVPLPYPMARLVKAVVPQQHLADVAQLGLNYVGADAERVGLVHEVLPKDQVIPRAQEKLVEFMSRDGDAQATIKRFLRMDESLRWAEGEQQHRDQFLDVWFSPKSQEKLKDAYTALFGKPSSTEESK